MRSASSRWARKRSRQALQRLGVVQPQDLDVGDQQAGALDRGQHLRQRRDVAAGEDVLGDPGVGDVRPLRAADRMQQHDAVVGQQLGALAEKGVVEHQADVLEHADRNDAVEFFLQVAIVLHAEIDRAGQVFFSRALAGALPLLSRQRDAGDAGAAEFREIKRKAAPAAADVERPLVLPSAAAWRRDGASWRAGRRRATARGARNRRRSIAGRHRGTANRAGRRDRNDARRCAARASAH